MRQTSSQTSKVLSLKFHGLKQPKAIDRSQVHVIAANFSRQRFKHEGLRTTTKWESFSRAPVLSRKAKGTTPLQASSKLKEKAAKSNSKYLKGEDTVCPETYRKSQVGRLHRLRNASRLCKNSQSKRIKEEREYRKQRFKIKRKTNDFDDTSRIKKRVKYLLNRMNKEQNLIDAYSAEGWKGQSREKLRPERELQKARAQILRFQLGIRDAVKELDLLGLDGTMKEYIFNSHGQIYHEDIFCAICKRQDVMVNNDIILCDGACDRAFHQLCLRPPLKTDEIPPDDEGWLCPVCDCKSECLDAVNAYFGTDYGVEDPWKKIFSEAVTSGSGDKDLLPAVEDWPSEDSSDADYVPGQDDINSKFGFRDQEGSNNESVSLATSDHSMSDSDTSDTADSRLSLLNELAEIMETESDSRDEVDPKEENTSVDEENVVFVDGKRQRKEVDYKKLHDEMFGKSISIEEASEDEEWGPRKRLRKSRDSLQLSQTEAKEHNVNASKLRKPALTESSSMVQKKQRRIFLSPHAVEKLRAAFKENPLPSRACKEGLSKQLGLSFGKVHIWFKNVRCAALKKGLIQRAKGRGKNLLGPAAARKGRQDFASSKVGKDPEREHWLALMDMLSEAEVKLEKLRSCLQHTQTEVSDSDHVIYVAVAELREKVPT